MEKELLELCKELIIKLEEMDIDTSDYEIMLNMIRGKYS